MMITAIRPAATTTIQDRVGFSQKRNGRRKTRVIDVQERAHQLPGYEITNLVDLHEAIRGLTSLRPLKEVQWQRQQAREHVQLKPRIDTGRDDLNQLTASVAEQRLIKIVMIQ